MRFGKLFIGLFTAVFLLTAMFFGKREYVWDGTVCLTAQITSQQNTEEISCWKKSGNEYFLFLPGYAQLHQVQLRTNTITPVYLDGRRLTDGTTCEGLQLDVPYDLCFGAADEAQHFRLTIFQSGNVPTLYVDTSSGTMEHIHERKGNEEPGSLRLYTQDGGLDYMGNLESIKGRGNSTWGYEKKPYNLTLYSQGDLLGMGAAQRWILLANAADPSQLRNKIVYDFARDVGMDYSAECEWVDLYLNGEYAGLYLLSERNEVHPERVAIGEENSFLVSKDWEWRFDDDNQPFVMTRANTALRIHHSSFQEDALLEILQNAENAILADYEYGYSSEKHWQEWIDTDSWAEKYLIEEIFGNPDAATLSQFFYYDGNGDGKIHAGPVWDFDLSMANTASWPYPSPNMFFANRPTIYGSRWFSALYSDGLFYDRVAALYETSFRPLLEKLLEGGIEAYSAQIAEAAGMNRLRWGSPDAAAETAALQQYMTDRMEFLNSVWLENEEYVYVLVRGIDEVLAYGLRPGACLPQLPVYESDETTLVHGWYDMTTGEGVDITQPIYEDTQIELRYEAVELPEPEEEEVQAPEEAEEPISLLRLGPALLFLGMLAAVCVTGLLRSRQGG